MNNLAIMFYSFGGLGFIAVFFYSIDLDHKEDINWTIWSVLALVYAVIMHWAFKQLQSVMFGQKYILDLTSYIVPDRCPICGNKASEEREMTFDANGGYVSVTYPFPIKLCDEHAKSFDKSWMKKIKGIRISRVVKNKYTVYLKSFDYLTAVQNANQTTNAVHEK